MKEQEVRNLVEYLLTEGPPLVITGSRGCGKSHLLKLLGLALEKKQLLHATVTAEERARTAFDEELSEEAERSMGRVLHGHGLKHRFLRSRSEDGGATLPAVAVEGGIMHLLVDGLDFVLSRHLFDASFLPLEIPRSMRLVVAVSRGTIVDTLALRGWRIHEVEPLEREERLPLIQGAGGTNTSTEALLNWRHGGHPQHLRMVAILAKTTEQSPAPDDSVSQVAEKFLAARSISPETAALLSVAEHGVPGQSLGNPLLRMMVSILDPLVVERRNLFMPGIAEATAVLQASCEEEHGRAAHRRTAEIYGDVDGLRLFREAAEHLLAINDHARLAEFLVKFEVFQTLVNNNQPLLDHCWRTLAVPDAPERHEKMLADNLSRVEVETRVALINNVALFAKRMGWSEMALRHMKQALAAAREAFPRTHNKVGVVMLNMADRLQKDQGTEQEVEGLYKELLEILDGPVPVDHGFPKRWAVLRNYAVFLEGIRREDEGLALREQGIAGARSELGARHPAVGNELVWASAVIRWYAPAKALAMAQEGYEILLAATGAASGSTLYALRMVAAAQQMLGLCEESAKTTQTVLEVGQTQLIRAPFEVGYALGQLIDLADARDDRATGLRRREEQYAHYCAHPRFGHNHQKALSAGWNLRFRYEAEGCFDKVLELDERVSQGYAALNGPGCGDVLAIQVASARVLWRMGRRVEAEARLEKWGKAIADNSLPWTWSQVSWLRAEWAREDGRTDEARVLMDQALANIKDFGDLGSGWGWMYIISAGHHSLAGDLEAATRHYEAGAGLIDDNQIHVRELALRLYPPSSGEAAGASDERSQRRRELEVRFALSCERPYLDRCRIPGRAIRAAWNPGDGRTLALLDKTGQTHLFAWHAESAHLERLDPPFARRELPQDLAAITLRWSASGSALRFTTPQADETLGTPGKDEAWVPACSLSPDGRYVAYLGGRSISVVPAQVRPSLRERLPNRPS